MTNKGSPMRLMRLSRVAAIGLLFSLVLAACVPMNAPRSSAEIAAAQSAEALAQQGQFDQAAQAYLALASQSPDTPTAIACWLPKRGARKARSNAPPRCLPTSSASV